VCVDLMVSIAGSYNRKTATTQMNWERLSSGYGSSIGNRGIENVLKKNQEK